MNPIFIHDGVRSATLSASSGSLTGYPLTNLQTDIYSSLWQSANNSNNQTLQAYFGSTAKAVSSVFIAHHNLNNLGLTALNIELSNDGSTWGSTYSVNLNNTVGDPLYIIITPAYANYIRLRFTGSSPLSSFPFIGMLYFGVQSNMPLYSNNPERGLQSVATVATALSGQRYGSSVYADRESWKIDFGGCHAADNDSFMRLIRNANGMQYPFWFCDMDGNWHFCRFKKNYMPYLGKGNIVFPLNGIEFDEERVGLPMLLPGGYTVPAPY